MSAPFHFKQFSIVQDRTPMKVGTDGVLLGAWVDAYDAAAVLDIGTGTGLIALMLAQRARNARIIAIDSHPDACREAAENFKSSGFSDRLQVVQSDIKVFQPAHTFDLILSNPPYFKSSLHAADDGRTQARHDIGFSTEDLAAASRWLGPKGRLAGIYPVDIFEDFHIRMIERGMQLIRKCTVQPTPLKPTHRVLFTYIKVHAQVDKKDDENIIIETDGRHRYSETYRNLTKDFYLGF